LFNAGGINIENRQTSEVEPVKTPGHEGDIVPDNWKGLSFISSRRNGPDIGTTI
jgi:hypothetical protein